MKTLKESIETVQRAKLAEYEAIQARIAAEHELERIACLLATGDEHRPHNGADPVLAVTGNTLVRILPADPYYRPTYEIETVAVER